MSEAEIHNSAGSAARLCPHARRGDGRGERRRLRPLGVAKFENRRALVVAGRKPRGGIDRGES